MTRAPVPGRANRFTLLVYRMPAKPTAGRVAVWRQLKKIGAIYLQQSACVFPANSEVSRDLAPILRRIADAAGEFHLLPLRKLNAAEEGKLIQQFQHQTANHYEEIIENCEVNFTKEIEFETFRKNFTYEEAEEVRTEFEKITAWFDRVRRRDWFGAPNMGRAKEWLERCEKMLEEFEARVFALQEAAGEVVSTIPLRQRRRRPRVISGFAETTISAGERAGSTPTWSVPINPRQRATRASRQNARKE
jgi:ChrB-like protein